MRGWQCNGWGRCHDPNCKLQSATNLAGSGAQQRWRQRCHRLPKFTFCNKQIERNARKRRCKVCYKNKIKLQSTAPVASGCQCVSFSILTLCHTRTNGGCHVPSNRNIMALIATRRQLVSCSHGGSQAGDDVATFPCCRRWFDATAASLLVLSHVL